MAKSQPPRKTTRKKPVSLFEGMLEKENFFIILAGVVLIIVGYFLMEIGGVDDVLSLTISPIILVIGYCVLIPFGIMYRRKSAK